MDRPFWWSALGRVAASLLGAAVSYSAWLAVFLLTVKERGSIWEALLWLLSPLATALGFAAGVSVAERLAGDRRSSFGRLLIWPLLGCAVGAGVVYWFGPMLIVFGMFVMGTASIAVREVLACRRRK